MTVRLIDADALIKKMASVARLAKSDPQKALMGRMLFIAQNAPTVDVKDINVPDKAVPLGRGIGEECSVCHEIQYGYGILLPDRRREDGRR